MARGTNLMQQLWFIIINISTCFGHLYAHLQEYRLYVLHMVFSTGCCGWGPKEPVCSLVHCVFVSDYTSRNFHIWCTVTHTSNLQHIPCCRQQYKSRLFQITNLMHNSFILQQYVCYTTILNMFRAAPCSSAGGQIVLLQPLVSSPWKSVNDHILIKFY